MMTESEGAGLFVMGLVFGFFIALALVHRYCDVRLRDD